MVVDDEQLVRDLLDVGLTQAGYEVRTTSAAAEALEEMAAGEFAIALIDLNMPGMGGMELLRHIHATQPEMAVVMISGVTDLDTALASIGAGAFGYVSKPFSIKAVVSTVERALDKRRLILENRNYQQNLEQLVKVRTDELERALEKIESTYDATIRALGAALDLRDSETEDHSVRVARYSMVLARILGVSEGRKLKDMEWGAYLHDIGKIGVADSILRKPGPLTPEEREIIQTHPALGHRILKGVPFLHGAAATVLCHHEWFNGAGYPRGLVGAQIPLSARIFAVVDAMDAMTTDRPYRKALPLVEVTIELRKLSNRQFDPVVVDAYLSVPESEWDIRPVAEVVLGVGHA